MNANDVPASFGTLVFNDVVMQQRLTSDVYSSLHETISEGRELNLSVANAVAAAMKSWAIENGATHYTHWFQPMTGITAGKHESFLTPKGNDKAVMEFSGKELIKGEPDASSFPSGGLRATFEARGYTAWDPTSYAFIMEHVLYIPTIFCSYTGDVLDQKTPLLRSVDALNVQALRVLHALGMTDVKRVTPMVGAEQEYFLVDKEAASKRKDLRYTGRTLLGANAPKGQELNDHYFGSIKPRISAYMRDLNAELWKLGISSKTEHNEAAPAQYEMAPVFCNINTATDQNQLTMEVMQNVAERHNMVCILHEKPFANVNGSGKHVNWSLVTDTGKNLFDPGKAPQTNLIFQIMLCAMISAVDKHQDILRASTASAGNDHRLGADEAPPAIISMFLGHHLISILDDIVSGTPREQDAVTKINMGPKTLPDFKRDTADRNRTSPFAFTGNKFEFRMPGSSASISGVGMTINVIMTDIFCDLANALEKGVDVRDWMREQLNSHRRILFNGNNYAAEWITEAEQRGLLNLKNTVDALSCYISRENLALFADFGIFTETEIRSRYEIQLENYCKVVNIEAHTLSDMAGRSVLPAALEYFHKLAKGCILKKELGLDTKDDAEFKLAKRINDETNTLSEKLEQLDSLTANIPSSNSLPELSHYYAESIIPAMDAVRAASDALETVMARGLWPFPTYGQLLFKH